MTPGQTNLGDTQFITFSCFKRRRVLNQHRCKQMVTEVLTMQLARAKAGCLGFVVMSDHVHALISFASENQLPSFMKQWKRLSSVQIKRIYNQGLAGYARLIDPSDPVWQAGYYAFAITTEAKFLEKLNYMHQNPVRAGLMARASDWPHSSAGWYEQGRPVGVPIAWPGPEPAGRCLAMPAA